MKRDVIPGHYDTILTTPNPPADNETKSHPLVTPDCEEFEPIAHQLIPQSKFRISEPKPHNIGIVKRLDFSNDTKKSIEDVATYISSLLPTLIGKLDAEGLLLKFQRLVELIVDNEFPIDNIALLLLLETVMWYSLPEKKCMEYSENTLQFWKVGYRLCHGTFLRFMGGSAGADTDVNFAVPTLKTLLKHKPFDLPEELVPGVIEAAVKLKGGDSRFQVLSFDGKKVAAGLTKTKGEEDLFGHEQGMSLEEKKHRLELNLRKIQGIQDTWKREQILPVDEIKSVIKFLSEDIRSIRQMKVKQEGRLTYFMKEAGPNWRESKFVFGISALQTTLYQENAYIESLLSNLHDILMFVRRRLATVPSWFALKSPQNLPAEFDALPFIQQRSEQWFAARTDSPVTGSTTYVASGLGKMKDLTRHYDRHILKVGIIIALLNVVPEMMCNFAS